jgi:hypothetical protein
MLRKNHSHKDQVQRLIPITDTSTFNVGADLSACSIRELRNLDNLHGDLTITGLENVKVGSDAREAKLINKKYLETLTLQWSDNNIYLEEEDEETSVDVFESLQPPSDLENLIVRNYCGSLFPVWIEKSPYKTYSQLQLMAATTAACFHFLVICSLSGFSVSERCMH